METKQVPSTHALAISTGITCARKTWAALWVLFWAFAALTSDLALATSTRATSETTPSPRRTRTKVIDFEDQVIEGVNKRPLDALALLGGNQGGQKRKHLYRKRIGYKSEIELTLQDMRVQ